MPSDSAARALADPMLVVEAGGARLALRARDVAEVIRPRPTVRVPHAPPTLLGVLNLRGSVLPVLSLAGLRGTEGFGVTSSSPRIVVLQQTPAIGLRVDAVLALGSDDKTEPIDAAQILAAIAEQRRPSAADGQPAGLVSPVYSTENAGAENERAFLSFRVGEQTFGLALRDVEAVDPLPEAVTPVTGGTAALLSVATVRDRVMPLLSARALLGKTASEPLPASAKVIVTRCDGRDVGLVVDALDALLRIPADAIEAAPPMLARGRGEAKVEAICRLHGGRRLVSVLSTRDLLDDNTIRLVREQSRGEQPRVEAQPHRDEAAEPVLVVRSGDAHYGIPIAAVAEVVRAPDVLARVPNAPAFVAGVMNRRGAAVPVIDMAQRVGPSRAEHREPRGHIVVLTVGSVRAGLLVDAVSGLRTVLREELTARVRSVEGGEPLVLVAPDLLLDEAERDVLASFVAPSRPRR